MKSVDRALYLLSYFTVQEPEWGLSELARKSKIDKATTLRILVALIRNGFVEQHPETKKYRLGIAVLRLARVREASFPLLSLVNPVLDRLAEEMQETAHATLASETAMITIAIAEPKRSTRVWVDPSQLLPFHATASGLAYLAFAAPGIREGVLASTELTRYTQNTLVEPEKIGTQLEQVRARGFAFSPGSFEAESSGIAAPIFSGDGEAFGSVAIAGVASRMTKDHQLKAARLVVGASVEISRAIGAEPHPNVLRAERELLNA
ncbi:IclR family transcriptional regulator protein (plasmid) [Sinorhizobium fredii]|uniref:IclR family transcriptional regulator protein n=2 Tax=Rhizobium fredii TaxID=380 RepID=A0A2L0HA52_RHIFR|nr:IclR family transcriptional regulator protein [Sinorhizobium fredii]